MNRIRSGLVRLALLLAGLLLTDQALRHSLLSGPMFLGKRLAPFDPPVFSGTQLRRLEHLRQASAGVDEGSILDPDLGWCPSPDSSAGEGLYHFDWAGCRLLEAPLSREKSARRERIVVVGDSYARGDEVAARDSWVGRLALEHEELEFANLGVGGYGIDQALLRWRRDGRPLQADQVWLVVMPTALLRVTSQFPPIQNHWTVIVTFKPAFTLDPSGELVLHRAPVGTLAEEVALIDDQAAFLSEFGERDPWIRRLPAAYAPAGSHWLHYLGVGRLCLTWLDHRGRAARAWLEEPEAEYHLLVRALITQLAQEVAHSGARFRLLVQPSREDLRERAASSRGAYWDTLMRELEEDGIEVLDQSESLHAKGCERTDSAWMPGRHYSPATHELVARDIERRWLGVPAPTKTSPTPTRDER